MTQNQIRYWELQETKRSNRAKEAETVRSDKQSEAIGWANAEINRWNAETNRVNAASNATQARAATVQAMSASRNARTNERNSTAGLIEKGVSVISTIGSWIVGG